MFIVSSIEVKMILGKGRIEALSLWEGERGGGEEEREEEEEERRGGEERGE